MSKERFKYHPAILFGFMYEDAGLSVDWDAIYEVVENVPAEQVEQWRDDYHSGRGAPS